MSTHTFTRTLLPASDGLYDIDHTTRRVDGGGERLKLAHEIQAQFPGRVTVVCNATVCTVTFPDRTVAQGDTILAQIVNDHATNQPI